MTVDDKLMFKSMLESMQYELSNQLGSEYCRKKYEVITKAIEELEQETVSKESYDHEYFLRKELDFKVARLEKQIAEQEPCEDAVSRQAVLDELGTCFDTHSIYDENNGENYIIYEDAVDMMEKLPPVTPTRKAGKWIEVKNKNGTVIALRCNCCEKSPKHAIRSLWCPNCGADMRGGE